VIRILVTNVLALFILLLGVQSVSSELLVGQTVNICDDQSEWPPFSYYERINGKKTNRLTGFSVDVFQEIFGPHGFDVDIRLIPWKRCMHEVAQGERFYMFLSGSFNEDRAASYYLSRPYYSTRPYYFYSREEHPDGLDIKNSKDLKNFRVCGISGYNYADYGLDLDEIDATATDYETLKLKIIRNRCDLFIENIEVMAGFSKIGIDFLADEDLGHAAVPEMEPYQFHMMFTRNALGKKLQSIVNEGLTELERSGKLRELIEFYAIPGN